MTGFSAAARGGRTVSFPGPWLLAPMEGVADRPFRSLVLSLGGCGGACSEFVRITVAPAPARVVARYLGPAIAGVPVGVQLMAAVPDHVAASAANAERAGAAWIDLNFGCPAPTVVGHCAGSALLAHPDRLAAIVRAAVGGTSLPVSAKLRAGLADDLRIEELVRAAVEAGAAFVIMHGRRRIDPYSAPADRSRIARAVKAAGAVPVVGNGGIETPDDARSMMRETGCSAVMVGRGAVADPWIFRQLAGGAPASAAEAVAFLHAYADLASAAGHQPLPRLKQLVRWLRAGGLFEGREEDRLALLRADGVANVFAVLERLAAGRG